MKTYSLVTGLAVSAVTAPLMLSATPAHASNPVAPTKPVSCTTPINVLWATNVDGPRPVAQRTGRGTTQAMVQTAFHATARGTKAVSPTSPAATSASTVVVEGIPGLRKPVWVREGTQWALRVGSGAGVTTTYKDVATVINKRLGGTCMATRTSQTVTSTPMLNVGKRYVGLRYVWGGTSLTKGADCSGYVQQVAKLNGKTLPRTSREQRRATRVISRTQARPGDLVFFARNGRVHHVGILADGGYVLNAPRTGTFVRYDRISTNFPGDSVSYGRIS